MRTIVEPKQHIDKLWGRQKIDPEATYRMMTYVMRVEHEGKTALHNVVTGHLVLLDEAEEKLLQTLPHVWTDDMTALHDAHFLVPTDFSEYKQVVKIKTVLRKFADARQKPGIYTYTILPTTACNARCYYCFEQGIKVETMTGETADEVVAFIKKNCNGQPVFLDWFGGEPTVAANRIDQICEGLQREGVSYTAYMTTNGYLFDEEMAKKAATLWKLHGVMISVDGTAETYNKTKRFVYDDPNPYERVIRNVGLLANAGIAVNLRMNYDLGNYREFPDLVDEVMKCYGVHPKIQVYVHPVNDEHPDENGKILHGTEEWFEQKTLELNNIVRDAGVFGQKKKLPCFREKECYATNRTAVVITPGGYLARCAEKTREEDYTGSIWDGETDRQKVEQWRKILDAGQCVSCVFFPDCMVMDCCSAKHHCGYRKELTNRYQYAIEKHIESIEGERRL